MADYPFFFTWTDQRSARPIEITGGDGAYFETAAGERWLDFASMSFHASLGHGHRRMIESVVRQAQAMCVCLPSAVFPAKIEAAERLLALAPPGFSKVFFTTGGAEANENAIKIARLVTGRHKLLGRYRSYHGATLGALSLTGDWRRPPLEPGIGGVVRALECYCDRCAFGQVVSGCARECARHIGDLLDLEGPGTVAAILAETVPGANGVLVPPPDYWPRVRAACDRHGTLLIADEVFTGFGRTGRCFAFEHFGVVPDIITVAKALTGGYAPLGAVLVHERWARHFNDRVLAAGLTQYAHPLGCAAAVEALRIYGEENLFERAARLGPRLLEGLARLRAAHPGPVQFVRGLGLLAAVELEIDSDQWSRLAAEVAARKLFLHLDPRRGMLVLAPPLILAEADLDKGLALLSQALAAALAQGTTAREQA